MHYPLYYRIIIDFMAQMYYNKEQVFLFLVYIKCLLKFLHKKRKGVRV